METLRSVVRAKCWANTMVTGQSPPPVATFKSFLGSVEFYLVRSVQHGMERHGKT